MSQKRKAYIVRLIARCLVLILCTAAAVVKPELYNLLDGMNFFSRLSPLHLLWIVWMVDMVYQIIPLKSNVALGSRKLFATCFRPAGGGFQTEYLQRYIKSANKAALKVAALWTALIAVIGLLFHMDLLNKIGLFLISVVFYVCDLICVLIWCPFRLIMKTRCCTTCRIFNWDHMMMFSPLIFLDGFYAVSLVVMAVLSLLVWEISMILHPERFWEKSNIALKCSECTDKLCTQYCGKA